ncbi:MAG TPA: hypothetical protein VMI94_13755 [Bryobacteraceae bacterium]|nr:hypothetical protein [Bryobacteraceae bacterium]
MNTTSLPDLLVNVCAVLRTHEMLIFELDASAAALAQLLKENPQLDKRFRQLKDSKAAELSQGNADQLRLIDRIAEQFRRGSY